MKTNKRAAQNCSAKATAQQSKIYKSTPGDRARRIDLIVCDVRGEHLGGELNHIGGIDLTTAEWKAIKKDASARGESSNAWLDRVITTNIPKAAANWAAAIQGVLGLKPTETEAVELLSKWQQESPVEFCRRTVLAHIDCAHDLLRHAAAYEKGNPKARAWALKFYSRFDSISDDLGLTQLLPGDAKGGAR